MWLAKGLFAWAGRVALLGAGLLALLAGGSTVAASTSPTTAYVTNADGGTVTPIDVATGKPGPEIKVGSGPVAVAVTPDGKTAYVVNQGGASGSGTVTPIDVATGEPGPEIKVGREPYGVAVTPDGKTAYVTNSDGDTVTPIDVATGEPGPEIKVGSWPRGVAVTPDGKTAYVTNQHGGTVTPIDVATGKPGPEIKVGSRPYGVAFTPLAASSGSPSSGSPDSHFSALAASVNHNTGAVTFKETVSQAGTFSWLITFQNGKVSVFSASTKKCKQGQVKLTSKCRPALVIFAKGSRAIAAAGSVSFTVKPTASALKALQDALKHKRGLPVTATLTFQSSLGGSPTSHTQSLIIKLKKRK
jgi:YVTN family beta-propeller protein